MGGGLSYFIIYFFSGLFLFLPSETLEKSRFSVQEFFKGIFRHSSLWNFFLKKQHPSDLFSGKKHQQQHTKLRSERQVTEEIETYRFPMAALPRFSAKNQTEIKITSHLHDQSLFFFYIIHLPKLSLPGSPSPDFHSKQPPCATQTKKK